MRNLINIVESIKAELPPVLMIVGVRDEWLASGKVKTVRDIVENDQAGVLIEGSLPEGWDLAGGWIEPYGRYLAVDHSNDIHHAHIALKAFEDDMEPDEDGKYSKHDRAYAVELALEEGWIRISSKGNRSFSAEWHWEPSIPARKALFDLVSKDPVTYQTYEVYAPGEPDIILNDAKIYLRQLRRLLPLR